MNNINKTPDIILQSYIEKWIAQGGRTEENIWGVKNFLTGQGLIGINALIKEAEVQKIAEILNRLREINIDDGGGSMVDEVRQILEAELVKLMTDNPLPKTDEKVI